MYRNKNMIIHQNSVKQFPLGPLENGICKGKLRRSHLSGHVSHSSHPSDISFKYLSIFVFVLEIQETDRKGSGDL